MGLLSATGSDQTSADTRSQSQHARHQPFKLLKGQRLRAIFQCLIRIGVYLDEQPIGPCGNGGQRHRHDQVPAPCALAGICNDGQV